ncbi:glutamine amidotransferase [Marinobacter koreensis]|uniref:Glutamine amidotransferase n=1 Tax=Marinobacter koreensis TaxID=335974 RepID=A0ABW0RNI9_9GAMM|nr:glutamine amidotransferase [Marinobacter koreensis]MCK7549440.1 glutamine amidotransferase [Marinobacter koreensis]
MTLNTKKDPRVAVIKTGTTYPDIKSRFGDFEAWFIRALSGNLDITVVDVAAGETPDAPGNWDGIVVTGSPAMVSDRESWSEATADWLAQAVAECVPLLGVCYGHQLLAHAFGGEVGYHPDGRETGTKQVERLAASDQDPLFANLPRTFPAQLTHRQSVLRLPPEAVLLARSAFEPHQAFRIGQCAWGVQFHPEFTEAIMGAYLDVQSPELTREGLDIDRLKAELAPAPEASGLLQQFSDLVLQMKKD